MNANRREWAEQVEIDIVNTLNGHNTNHLYVTQAVETLKAKFNIKSAEWIGNGDYHTKGDIKLLTTDGVKYIELKTSDKKTSGTTANPGQAFFGKLIEDTLSYTEWEKEDGVFQQRYNLVGNNNPISKGEYEKTLRTWRSNDATNPIFKKIQDITNAKKGEYIDYLLPKLNKQLEKINSILYCIKNGEHTIKRINEVLSSNKLPANDYFILVITQYKTDNPGVTLVDTYNTKYNITAIKKGGEQSMVFVDDTGTVVFRFAVNWKNICQGGATPCFSVFSK